MKARLWRSWAAAALLVGLAACGGSSDEGKAGNGDADQQAAAGDGTTSTSIPGAPGGAAGSGGGGPGGVSGSGSSATTAPGGSGGSGGSGVQSSPGVEFNVPLTARVSVACLRPGGTQTVTLTSEPKTNVGYDSVYADGKTGWSPDHYGGSNKGETDASGQWQDTFVLKPGAPPGKVEVNAIAGNARGAGKTATSFAVAKADGTCS